MFGLKKPTPTRVIPAREAEVGMRLRPGPDFGMSNVPRRGETITKVTTGREGNQDAVYIQGEKKGWVWCCTPGEFITVDA